MIGALEALLPATEPRPRPERHRRIVAHLRGRGIVPIAQLAEWMRRALGSTSRVGDSDLRDLAACGVLLRTPTRGSEGCVMRAYAYSLADGAGLPARGAPRAPSRERGRSTSTACRAALVESLREVAPDGYTLEDLRALHPQWSSATVGRAAGVLVRLGFVRREEGLYCAVTP